jgi:phosphatidylglycerophosphate synthase
VRRAADVLTLGRLGLAVVLPLAIARGGMLPLVLWTLAAASDYVDGPLARRSAQATARGMMLDNVADVAFVLGGLAAAAAFGLVPWLVPGAVLLSVVDYGRTLLEERRGVVRAGLARSRVGHAAGVLNYACLGVVCGRLAMPGVVPPVAVVVVELATVVANLAAVAGRVIQRSGRR